MPNEIHICASCGEVVDPADLGVIEVVEILHVETYDASADVEGHNAFFHKRCYPSGSRKYRRRKPEGDPK